MKGKEIKETRSWIKEHTQRWRLSGALLYLFRPASTKEASTKPAENRDRRLKFSIGHAKS